MTIANCRFPIANLTSVGPHTIGNRQLTIGNVSLLRLFVTSVLATTAAEFTEFQPIGRGLLILGRYVIPTLTILTLKHNVIAWHFSNLENFLSTDYADLFNRIYVICGWIYSITSETVPAPTVRPPSRIAKRNPFSIAIGAINSIDIATLSPGITISTPSGKCATPVTSVVRK